jgi:hypothetical protein
VQRPRALRYVAAMKETPTKKTARKLVLHSQTLRLLANLDLSRAIGGFDSGPAVTDIANTGRVACPTWPR